MKFPATIRRNNGYWSAQHDGPDAGRVEVRAPTRDEAIERLIGEIRYRLELCPCSGESYQHIQIDVIET
jgi:hypothetical protein